MEADSAMTLVLLATTALEPPPALVTTDVTRTTEVREDAAFLLVLLAESGKDIDVEKAAESEKPPGPSVSGNRKEVEVGPSVVEEVVEVGLSVAEEVVELELSVLDVSVFEVFVSVSLIIWRLLIRKRTVEVLQHPLLESPSASGRLASQQ